MDYKTIFFRNLKDNDQIVFLTYSFDEEVLVELLNNHKVENTQKIIVYYEIMRHRGNGILKNTYKMSETIAVDIDIDEKKCSVPLFHPKAWFVFSNSERIKASRILIGSFNLSRYHFSKENNVIDSIIYMENLSIKAWPFSQKKSKKTTIKIKPFTGFLDLTAYYKRLEFFTDKAIAELLSWTHDYEGKASYSFSPFYSKIVLDKIYGLNSKYHHYCDQPRKKPILTRLHAKGFIESAKLYTGSFNLTSQATGLTKDNKRPFMAKNCEIIVLMSAPASLRNKFENFKDLKKCTNDYELDEPSHGVEDSNDYGSWKQMKEQARKAPIVKLDINNKGNPYLSFSFIKSVASREPINILSSVGEECLYKNHPYNKRKFNKVLKSDLKIAQIIQSNPVYVKCRDWGKVEIDMGKYWDLLNLISPHKPKIFFPPDPPSPNPPLSKKTNPTSSTLHVDIRFLRDNFLKRGCRSFEKDEAALLRWLLNNDQNNSTLKYFHYPKWFYELKP